MAHPFLHPADVGLRDHPRTERMAQVMEPERSQPSFRQRSFVAATERRAVQMPTSFAGEDQVIIAQANAHGG